MRTSTLRSLAVAVAVAALALAACAGAGASSIVYIKGGNVWISAPDGSNPYQVTLDGTTADPYYHPSQSDDGTIVAVRGEKPAQLYRLKQNGDQLNAPFATASPMGNLLDAEVSPDGALVAYTFVTMVNNCWPYSCAGTDAAAAYTYADHFGDAGGGLQQSGNWHSVSWASSGRALLSDNSNIVYYDDARDGTPAAEWFDECTAGLQDCSQGGEWSIHDAHVSRDGRKIAWIWQAPDPDPFTTADEPYLQLGTVGGDVATGAPPAAPTTPACNIGPGPKETSDGPHWDRPTFSPDGAAVAWSEPDGVHVADASMSTATCGGDHLVISGGSEPFWGPANVNPGPRTTPGGGGTGGGGTGGSGGTGGGGGGTVPTPTPGPQPGPVCCSPPSAPPAPALTTGHQHLRTIVAQRVVRVRCRLTQAGRCSVRVAIRARDARRLHLHVRRGAKTVTLGRGAATLSAAGTRTLKVRLSRTTAHRLRRARRLRLTFATTATYGSGSSATHATATRTFTVRR